MATMTIDEAEALAQRKRPWTFGLTLQTTSPKKFWYATGRGTDEKLEVVSGHISGKPGAASLSVDDTEVVDWGDLQAKVDNLLANGFTYTSTGHKKMTDASWAIVKALRDGTPLPTPPVSQGILQTSIPLPGAAPAPVPPAPVFDPPPMGTPKPGITPLTSPYDEIRALHPAKDRFDALDENGDVLCTLTVDEGRGLAQDHGVPVVWAR